MLLRTTSSGWVCRLVRRAAISLLIGLGDLYNHVGRNLAIDLSCMLFW